jgi:hypothetical protein
MGARLFEVGAYLIPTLEQFLMLKSVLEDNKGCNVEIARPRAHVELQSSGEAPASILLLPFALLGYCFGLSLGGIDRLEYLGTYPNREEWENSLENAAGVFSVFPLVACGGEGTSIP